ncbi:hypothetical protein CLV80_104188 [Yoonia maritima]|uniref:Uncharacterized protein n=1 Tax=Yoonia maritima TaxID=1435347 RepID=A0A2T0W0A3_9RHOB|nr:hypothetical protein [Yoonia maritima]PRY78223.1 hypothetical protein CLV80_104188 [Yoonia maritima]
MNNDQKQKDVFAERLSRIEERNNARLSDPPPKTPPKPRYGEDQPQSYALRNFFIWSTIIAVCGGGLFYGYKQIQPGETVSLAHLVEATKTYFSGSTGMVDMTTGRASRRTDAPPPMRELTDSGWTLRSPAVATPDQSEVTVDQIAIGFIETTRDTIPGDLIPFDTNTECTFRRPQSSEVIQNVRIGSSTAETSVHMFSKEQIASALSDHIEGLLTQVSGHYKVGKMASGRMKPVDVFVTDDTAPVYLILQSSSSDIIWNVHLSEGAEIAHIAMIGNNSALVSPPGNPSFEAIRVSDFVQNNEFGSNDEVRPCMVAPWRQPQEHWLGYQKAQKDNDLYENQMYSYNTGYRAYNAWFTSTFGADASTNLTTASKAAHVIAGPVASSPIQFTPFTGQAIYHTPSDFVVVSDEARQESHDTLLMQAIGGDIALLNPDPMEVSGQ